MDRANTRELMQAAGEAINAADGALLTDIPLETYIAEMDREGPFAGYHHFPPALAALCDRVKARVGQAGLYRYHQMVMLRLIDAFLGGVSHHHYPDAVRELFHASFRRILLSIEQQRKFSYEFSNDSFRKDLGICRQRLIPAGIQVLEIAGVPRSWVLKAGIQDAPRLLRGVAAAGGFRPYFEMHTDRRYLRDFTPAGWRRCYLLMAELLRMNPTVRGVVASTWWYDPAVSTISPRLRFLREDIETGGGVFIRLGEDENATADAVANSPERHRLYQAGEYRPQRYGVVWPARRLLGYADRLKASGPGG